VEGFASEKAKQSLKSNGQIVYSPTSLDEGNFYARLRNNNFYYEWANEDATHSTHLINALGASLVYKSAKHSDFDFTAGLYVSTAFFDESGVPVANLKAGKDLVSRYDYSQNGDVHMAVIGQANVRYSGIKGLTVVVGRQFVETFYTKSNDTKMIPNAFDGVTATIKSLKNHAFKLAYLNKQKLRDHTEEHSVLAYDGWRANDDSAMHQGLTYTALQANSKPTNSPLIVAEVKNASIENLKIDVSSYHVPELLSQIMSELNYKMDMGSYSITPGIRYLKQFDNGAGVVGGASLSGLARTTGYSNPLSLEAQMLALRIVAKMDDYKLNLGYSNILDEADLVTPWRGFPTAGYTRSMGIYNWRANTQSYRLELVKGANSSGVYKDLFIQASILYFDGDESKYKGKDETYYYLGLIQNVPSYEELQWRLRLGYADFVNGVDAKFNYLDSRFELNYLF